MGAVVGTVPVEARSENIGTDNLEAASDSVGPVAVGTAGRCMS